MHYPERGKAVGIRENLIPTTFLCERGSGEEKLVNKHCLRQWRKSEKKIPTAFILVAGSGER